MITKCGWIYGLCNVYIGHKDMTKKSYEEKRWERDYEIVKGNYKANIEIGMHFEIISL